MRRSNYDKHPYVEVESQNKSCYVGWPDIISQLNKGINSIQTKKKIVVIECYHGVDDDEVISNIKSSLHYDLFINSKSAFKSEKGVRELIYSDVTDDKIFGYISRLNMHDFLDVEEVDKLRLKIEEQQEGTTILYGIAASCILSDYDLFIYADMARWEIQKRMRKNEVNNLGIYNKEEEFSNKYKQGYFVDWRVCDRLKKKVIARCDYLLDTNIKMFPKLIEGKAILKGLELTVHRPFRIVPFFDPGPWGGQWMKEVCDLDRAEINYAWCFDCVPEENSLLLGFGDIRVEIPSINLVFFQTDNLLGAKVHARFGDEFPIRFDFLDTMGGGNLSLQVHPLTEYIQEEFGVHYTQDESYYFIDAKEDAFVYLGLNENVCRHEMLKELRSAQNEGKTFNAEKHVKKWPIQKHDHVSIPAGTVHCSGADGMVLEISATPYIFTFKLWDWDRLGMDGTPRPINIDHGEKAIQWNRTESWIKKNALNLVETIGEGDGWKEERTGLNELEFIETRRHWFTKRVSHNTHGIFNVLNLVEGEKIIIESPSNAFEPFIVHYAETFIVPASVGEYTIRPFGEGEGKKCATIKAFVRI